MLTTEAVNALLKTLEEPPENTLFILCTTEADKIPETLISRCTRITFRKPTLEEAVASLLPVVEGEKLTAEKGTLQMIARAARGSFRDGTKILEQIAINSHDITLEMVGQMTGIIEAADPEKFVTDLSLGKTGVCLETIAELDRQGVNLRRFVEILAESLREELLMEINEPGKAKFRKDQILKLVFELDKAYEQMKTAAVTQLPLEIWVIENTEGNPQESIRKIDITSSDPPLTLRGGSEGGVMSKKTEIILPKSGSGKGKYSLEDVVNRWPDIMKAVKPKNHSVEALLRSTKPLSFDGEKLELEVFYKFHKDKLETEKCRQIVETSVMEVFSVGSVKLNLKLGQKSKPVQEEDIVKAAEEIFKVGAV
jgi:DNA polymerase III gamma/tau subunit